MNFVRQNLCILKGTLVQTLARVKRMHGWPRLVVTCCFVVLDSWHGIPERHAESSNLLWNPDIFFFLYWWNFNLMNCITTIAPERIFQVSTPQQIQTHKTCWYFEQLTGHGTVQVTSTVRRANWSSVRRANWSSGHRTVQVQPVPQTRDHTNQVRSLRRQQARVIRSPRPHINL